MLSKHFVSGHLVHLEQKQYDFKVFYCKDKT